MSTAALVLAAGRGERLGAGLPKALVSLAGVPLVVRAVEAIAAVPEIERVVPVVPPGELARFAALLSGVAGAHKLAPPVEGGRERQDSVRAGLASLADDTAWVAVHDAARALVRGADVSRVIAAARRHGAALLAVPLRDTMKRVRDGRVLETPPRAECWAAQTPQVFAARLLREALAKADAEGFLATDDAQLVERLGAPVAVVEGEVGNLKITTPEDLAAAEVLLRARGERAA
jgi:2-C-methyl-D-erythritol 4-phosphate cytidylyltransferase